MTETDDDLMSSGLRRCKAAGRVKNMMRFDSNVKNKKGKVAPNDMNA